MKLLIACVVAAMAVPGITSVYAADANKSLVTIEYTDTVAPAEMQAYEAGIKAYVRCLREHGVTFDEYAFTHETGRDTYQISFEREPMTWAQRDSLGSESRPCKPIFNAQVNPHQKSESGAVMVEEPAMSHLRAGVKNHAPPQFLHVVNYTLKPGPAAHAAFTDAVRKITAAATRTKWPYYWNTVAIEGGGDGAPDYRLDIGGTNWVGVAAEPEPSLWKMVADADGQTEANAIRKSLDDAIVKMSDHFDMYNADLSYIAGK